MGAQVIPTNVTFKKAGFVCHIEMLGLKIQVCDTVYYNDYRLELWNRKVGKSGKV